MQLNIFATNSYISANESILRLIGQVDKTDLDTQHLVIVSDKSSMYTETQILERYKGFFNVQVLTMSRLSDMLIGNYPFLTKQGSVMLLYKIIQENKDRLNCYHSGTTNRGFAIKMYETISKLKYNKITPQMLNTANVDNALGIKIEDIKLIYSLFTSCVENKFVDSADRLNILDEAINATELLANSVVYIKDFDNFSVQEYCIIRSLIAKCKQVNIATTYIKDKVTLSDNSIYNGLISIARGLNISARVTFVNESTNELTANISRAIFNTSTVGKGEPFIYNALDETEEISHLCKYILHSVRNEGLRYRDIAVVSANLDASSLIIEQYCKRYEIPFFVDRKRSLSQHSLVQYVVELLSIKDTNFAYIPTCSLIKNYFFNCNYASVEALDNLMIKYNNSRGLFDSKLSEKDEPLVELSKEAVEKLKVVTQRLTYLNSTLTYLNFVRDVINSQEVKDCLINLAGNEVSINCSEGKEFTSQVLDKLNSVLDEMLEVVIDADFSLSQFIGLFVASCDAVSVSVLPPLNDCVLFTTLDKSNLYGYKLLMVINACDGLFPSLSKDNNLISDGNIKQLASVDIAMSPTVLEDNLLQYFKAYQLLLNTTDKLYISYSSHREGKPSLISNAISNLVDKLNATIYSSSTTQYRDIYTIKTATADVIADMRGYFDGTGTLRLSALNKCLSQDLNQYIVLGSNIPQLNNGRQLFARKETTSVSRLECYYTCAYKHFLQYGLGLRKKTVAELNVADLGTFLHALLEIYTRDYLYKNDTDSEIEEKVCKVFDDILTYGTKELSKEYLKALLSSASISATFSKLKQEAIRVCKAINEQMIHSQFEATFFEASFGYPNDKASVKVQVDSNTLIKVRGKIDRIDVKDNKCLIIDYKSGSPSISEKAIFNGTKLQLLTYLKAAQSMNLEPVGVFYVKLDGKWGNYPLKYIGRVVNDVEVIKQIDSTIEENRRSKFLSGVSLNKDESISSKGKSAITAEQLNCYADYGMLKIKQAINEYIDGNIAVNPTEKSCVFCDYKVICPYNDTIIIPYRKLEEASPSDIVDYVKKEGNYSE